MSERRMRVCVENWPGAESGAYDPRCCRFPKSCSPYPYQEAIDAGNVTDADLEPVSAPVTAPVPAGPTDAQGELREAIARAISSAEHGSYWWPYNAADAVLALPAVRAALDAQETVRRVEALADQFKALAGSHERSVAHLVNGEYRADQIGLAMGYRRAALALRRALAGES